MQLSDKLLNKYNVPVPRYTSYPPANHFAESVSSEDYVYLIGESNQWDPAHIALYVHIPFCNKICFYCGCNAYKLKDQNEVARYMDALKKEISIVSATIDNGRKVKQVHFGGGTPNAIEVEYLEEIMELFRERFTFDEDPEIAIEVHPAYVDFQYLDRLLQSGFNRFSLGIQDFNNEVLKQVNREPSPIPVEDIVAYLREHENQAAVNLDFIYGLPGQTVEGFRITLEKAAAVSPDRLVTFSYAHVPWLKKHQQILEKRELPDPEDKRNMFLAGYELLKGSGYYPIGLDHFVKQNDNLFCALESGKLHRNFQGYCTRETTGQVYAFGVTAISQLERAYIQNTKSIAKYTESLSRGKLPVEKGLQLTDEQRVVREVITSLMCNLKLDWAEVGEQLQLSAEELKNTIRYEPEVMKGFAADGLLEWSSNGLKITETGSIFVRNIAAALDPAYEIQTNKYSTSI